MKITEYQKEFILNYFFKNNNYPGWRNIGEKLLEHGEAIVAGDRCIWNGGIGNFIKIETTTKLIDCLVYKFDLEHFLSSSWYKDVKNSYLNDLKVKKNNLENEINEIKLI